MKLGAPLCKVLCFSEKSINKTYICKNKANIYINKTIICTNISFIYTFLRRIAVFRLRKRGESAVEWVFRVRTETLMGAILFSGVLVEIKKCVFLRKMRIG